MITDSFDAGAVKFPDRVCLQDSNTRLTYREVESDSHAVAFALGELGLGDAHVGILTPNNLIGFVAMLGILRSGATYVPLNGRDAIDDLIWFMHFTEVSALVCHAQFAPHLARIREGVPTLKVVIGLDEPVEEGGPCIAGWSRAHAGRRVAVRKPLDAVAQIKSSGGTTGRPKAIMQTHRSLLAAYRIQNQFAVPVKDPVHLVVAPLTHAAGATTMAMAIFGARNVLTPSPDAGGILEAIEREKVTHLFLTPTMIYRLLAHPDASRRDASSLECVMYGAAPMSVEKLREALALWGPVFFQAYGQAEVPGVITCLSRSDHDVGDDPKHLKRLSSAGRPTGACEVALMDDDGRIVGVGERGEIVAKGELVSPGYFNNPQANADAHQFGWHHTGDVGEFDADGYLYIVDRKKDMIISGGFNIYPGEIEQVIWGHPAVQDCAVVGIPDEDWGERVTAVVELKPGQSVSADELIAMCRQRLGSTKAPKDVVFWDALPRSTVGKVLKKDIRSQFGAKR